MSTSAFLSSILSPAVVRRAFVAAALVASSAVTIMPHPAAAQSRDADLRVLADQVERLQRELTVLQRNVYQGRPAASGNGGGANVSGGQLLDLSMRLDEFENKIRDLTGRVEEMNHRVLVMEQRFDKLSSDVDFRLSGAAGGAASGMAGAPNALTPNTQVAQPTPPAGAGDPSRVPTRSGTLGTLSSNDPVQPGSDAMAAAAAAAAAGAGGVPPREAAPATPAPNAPAPAAQAAVTGPALPDGSPEDQYKYAFGLLSKADYAGAERSLTAFVEKHPNHVLAGNAQYWLGESYYARNDFNQAARAFAIGYQKYPKSSKAPDNLLKLGLSLGSLGKNKEACQSYRLLKSDFPKAPTEILRRAESEEKRLRCG